MANTKLELLLIVFCNKHLSQSLHTVSKIISISTCKPCLSRLEQLQRNICLRTSMYHTEIRHLPLHLLQLWASIFAEIQRIFGTADALVWMRRGCEEQGLVKFIILISGFQSGVIQQCFRILKLTRNCRSGLFL